MPSQTAPILNRAKSSKQYSEVLNSSFRMNKLLFCFLPLACSVSFAQTWSLTTFPISIPAGGQPFTIAVSLQSSDAGVPTPVPQSTWVVRWNGSPQPTTVTIVSGTPQVLAFWPSSMLFRQLPEPWSQIRKHTRTLLLPVLAPTAKRCNSPPIRPETERAFLQSILRSTRTGN